nr:MAG TPA: hypothetical protein [Caudoviricetes sp.]
MVYRSLKIFSKIFILLFTNTASCDIIIIGKQIAKK